MTLLNKWQWFLLLSLISFSSITPHGSCLEECNDPSEATQSGILKELERALLQDDGNGPRLRRAFFHSPTADPILLKVVYNVTYGQNITTVEIASGDTFNFSESSASMMNSIESDTVELVPKIITYGWTSSLVYTVFHPIVLTNMQLQIPFTILRAVHRILRQRSPEADTFLWDGFYDLPTLHLNIHIVSLPCVPSQDLFELVLMDFNTQLKVYTDQHEAHNFGNNIGYTVPSNSVSTKIKLSGEDVIIENLYSFIMCFIYAVFVVTFYRHYYPQHSVEIGTFITNNIELIGGLTIAAVLGIAVETIARFVNCAVWSVNIDSPLGIVIPLWLPQSYIFILGTFMNIFYHIMIVCRSTENDHDRNPHILLPVLYMMFGLLYTLFPAMILMLTYPNQVIAIILTIATFLFATTIFFAIMIKLYRYLPEPRDGYKKLKFILCTCIPFYIVVVFLKCISVLLLYLLIISRGSAINSGPLILLTTLPSAVVAALSWIAKKGVLRNAV